jgi:hypothetical protein
MYLLIVLGIILKIVNIRVDATDNYKLSTTRLLRSVFVVLFTGIASCMQQLVIEGRISLLSSLFYPRTNLSTKSCRLLTMAMGMCLLPMHKQTTDYYHATSNSSRA